MKSMTYCRIVGFAAAIAAVAPFLTLHAERKQYSDYEPIVIRQMFGQPPPGFDPTKPPSEVSAKEERAKEQELTKEQEQIKSAIHFSMINETPSGETAVGFTDNSDSKNPKHYYLKEGESRDGWTVKEADALKAEMTIVKGEIEVTLTIGGNSANGGTKRSGTANAGGKANAVRPNLLGGGRMGGGRSMGSLRERRQLRAQQKAEEAKAAAEEKAKAEAAEREREERHKAELEAEKAEREKEREETQKRLAEMAEEIKRQREESAKKTSESGEGPDSKEGEGE